MSSWGDIDEYKKEMIKQACIISIQVVLFIVAFALSLSFFGAHSREFVKLTDNLYQTIYSLQLELDSKGVKNRFISQMNPIIGSKKTRDLYLKTNNNLRQLTKKKFEMSNVLKVVSNTDNIKTVLNHMDIEINDDKNKYAVNSTSGIRFSSNSVKITDYDSEEKSKMKKIKQTAIGGSDIMSFTKQVAASNYSPHQPRQLPTIPIAPLKPVLPQTTGARPIPVLKPITPISHPRSLKNTSSLSPIAVASSRGAMKI